MIFKNMIKLDAILPIPKAKYVSNEFLYENVIVDFEITNANNISQGYV